jgi:RNA polymerase sigma factor (sigma-70 family)
VSAYRKLLSHAASVAVEAETRDCDPDEGGIVVPDEFSPMEERIDQRRAQRFVTSQIAGLPSRQAAVITLSFEEERTLQSIAKTLGVSTARAGQIRKVALEKLRRAYVANSADPRAARA